MKHVLAEGERGALRDFVRLRPLIALDYDGTLAPIAPRPEMAVLPKRTRALLVRLARRYPVIVLTGRSRRDTMHLLAGVPVMEVIGSHGAEVPGSLFAPFMRRVQQWRDELARALRSVAGVRIEDKKYSLAVHFRQSGDPVAAWQAIVGAANTLKGARIVGGKKVVNVVAEEAPDKGGALVAACARLGCERAVFVGDDETDEPAFALGASGHVFGIRVGAAPVSKAAYFLESQDEVDALLELLLE